MLPFLITITAKGERGSFEDNSRRNTRIIHVGFVLAASKGEAQTQANAMCTALEQGRKCGDDPPFSADVYNSEYGYQAEVAGPGDLIRIAELDD